MKQRHRIELNEETARILTKLLEGLSYYTERKFVTNVESLCLARLYTRLYNRFGYV